MRALLVSALALAAVSCGHKDEIDPEFHPHVDSFMTMCRETSNDCKMHNFSIEFVDDIPGDTVGLCQISFTQANKIQQKITIERSYKDSPTLSILIWHEAHHCLRFQEHTNDDKPHIMRPYLLNEQEWEVKSNENWLRESFQRNVRYKL